MPTSEQFKQIEAAVAKLQAETKRCRDRIKLVEKAMGDLMRASRKQAGMQLKEMSYESGIHNTYLCALESGHEWGEKSIERVMAVLRSKL